jgi:hypothetical protein
MASYFYQLASKDFWSRFDELWEGGRGAEEWRSARNLRLWEFGDDSRDDWWAILAAAKGWLNRVKGARTASKFGPDCPRVFVSHKQEDEQLALQIAKVIHGKGFDVWVDVLQLPKSAPAQPNTWGEAILIAAMIEMALINCTHLVAVMTTNTVPSRWVPYEYGRMKDDPPAKLTVSAWRDASVAPWSLTEYMHLGPIFDSRRELEAWLQREGTGYNLKACQVGPWPQQLVVAAHGLPP